MGDALDSLAFGTRADLQAGVNIGRVYGGYFSSPERVAEFCQVGIDPLLDRLPHCVGYVDLGGGQGTLASGVSRYLVARGKTVYASIVDSNPQFVEAARQIGLSATVCDIAEYSVSDLDLLTMRSVLHYNAYLRQLDILVRACQNLCRGGVLVSQFTTGTKEACLLRSDIVNSALLGRSNGADGYNWVTVEEYLEMSRHAGFSSARLAGYASDIVWGPREQWSRFYGKALAEAETNGDAVQIAALSGRREAYIAEANRIIESYVGRYSAEHLGVERQGDSYGIRSTYPIVVSRK